ncbi:MAG: hypothetical protein ACREEM_54910 [Blastocatellia bacterium]
MLGISERYLVDERGARVAVQLDIETYQKILDALEELECIRVYDEAKSLPRDFIPFEQAVAEIESRQQ